jgi:hypothetical protein
MLTEMKKGDRETMARMVEDLCRRKGATVTRLGPDERGPAEVVLNITLGEARVTVDFDGSKGRGEGRDVYCMPWNTTLGSRARMTSRFGHAVGASVNPHHRAKCTGFADGIDELLDRLESALDSIADGTAFENDVQAAA